MMLKEYFKDKKSVIKHTWCEEKNIIHVIRQESNNRFYQRLCYDLSELGEGGYREY